MMCIVPNEGIEPKLGPQGPLLHAIPAQPRKPDETGCIRRELRSGKNTASGELGPRSLISRARSLEAGSPTYELGSNCPASQVWPEDPVKMEGVEET